MVSYNTCEVESPFVVQETVEPEDVISDTATVSVTSGTIPVKVIACARKGIIRIPIPVRTIVKQMAIHFGISFFFFFSKL